ncbi:hypothetical protein Pfo_015318 [Paulownia fortunei]|nr:hypothetical protein Pfo_015318 [Paulownia fortunei]
MGTDPNCDIKLEHPSISGCHLQIRYKPSSRSLFAIDMASVHGTWISGKRVKPGRKVKLNEGDTLYLGTLSRLYRLNWVPLRCAYNIDYPFVAQLDASDAINKETEGMINQNNTMKAEKKRWIIVVDTACLLNQKSRKELQLLQGLRGTTLVIPKIVVRDELDMFRSGSRFTKTTKVSAAFQWIKECVDIAKWWIHVRSSAEEGTEDKGASSVGSILYCPYSLQEIVTPTAADYILEFVLSLKRTSNDGKLVLLSDDVTLRIEAMAEGIISESAEQFRRSLINPFSVRFLYSDSSPIGPICSSVDDAVLKEKYYPIPSKKLPKSEEAVKGLKLILQFRKD